MGWGSGVVGYSACDCVWPFLCGGAVEGPNGDGGEKEEVKKKEGKKKKRGESQRDPKSVKKLS